MKHFFWSIYFVFLVLLALFPILGFLLVRIFLNEEQKEKFLSKYSSWWGKRVILSTGSHVAVSGLEHLPEKRNVLFVSNHQSVLDIPLIFGFIPRAVGFIGKKELKKVPIINIWMMISSCVFIDRKSPRNAINAIKEAIQNIKDGHPMVIFPEGTRGGSAKLGKFKKGSMKLALRSNCLVVPLTINGTRNMFENNGNKIRSAEASLHIHPPMDISQLSEEERENLDGIIYSQIESKLEK